jgi:hypothetical protein
MMKAYGYERGNEDAESPLELREATLALTVNEISTVIAFLQHAKEKFSQGEPVAEHAHVHFRDWLPGWTDSEADIVILYED